METKKCFWCGREFPIQELSRRGNCFECALERVSRWNELVRDVHRTFIQEEIDRANNEILDDSLEELW